MRLATPWRLLLLCWVVGLICAVVGAISSHTFTGLRFDTEENREQNRAEARAVNTLRGHDRGRANVIVFPDNGDHDVLVGAETNGLAHAHTAGATAADSSVDDPTGSLSVSPSEVEFSWVETCTLVQFALEIKNTGDTPVQIKAVLFDHPGFSYSPTKSSDWLQPDEDENMLISFVSGEPETIDSIIIIVLSSGRVLVPVRGRTRQNALGLKGLHVTIPAESTLEQPIDFYNPSSQDVRVTEIFSDDGVGEIILTEHYQSLSSLRSMFSWDIPSRTSRTLATVIFRSTDVSPSHYSRVHVLTTKGNFELPFHVEISGSSIAIEPRNPDVGVFTNDGEEREISLIMYNMSPRPVTVHGTRIIQNEGLVISSDLQNNHKIVSPLSRVQLNFNVGVTHERNGARAISGLCSIRIQLLTNSTFEDVETDSHMIHFQGYCMKGQISYFLSDTTFRVITNNKLHSRVSRRGYIESTVEKEKVTFKSLTLKNEYDVPIELRRVSVAPECSEIEVLKFARGVVPAMSDFPAIDLHVRPLHHLSSSRSCLLRVESNATVSVFPITLYNGYLHFSSSRLLTKPFSNETDVEKSSCDNNTRRCSYTTRRHKIKRDVTVDLGNVAADGFLVENVTAMNANPIFLQSALTTMPDVDKTIRSIDIEPIISSTSNDELSVELALLQQSFRQQDFETLGQGHRGTLNVELFPGQSLCLNLRIRFGDETGGEPTTSHVATIETDFEIISILLQFQVTDGSIYPKSSALEISDISDAGLLGAVRIPFVSTFDFDIRSREVVVTAVSIDEGHSRVLSPWNLPFNFPANRTTDVSLVLFSPAFYDACKEGSFLTNCFHGSNYLNLDANLSDFGSLVSSSDIRQLTIRETHWKRQDLRLSYDLTIITEAMHTRPTRITLAMKRPTIFPPDLASAFSFSITEVQHEQSGFISVYNPSEFAVKMELAVPQSRSEWFYECDDDLTEAECVREWQDIARESSKLSTNSLLRRSSAPPFFFKRAYTYVAGKAYAQLGPIHFFPSQVGRWDTDIFVRNELTHIEKVQLHAESGIGTLVIDLVNDDTSLSKAASGSSIRFDAPAFTEEEMMTSGLRKVLVLSNSGSYDIRLTSIRLIPSTQQKSFGFAFSYGQHHSIQTQILEVGGLVPGASMPLFIDFLPDCYHTQVESELVVQLADSVKQFILVGRQDQANGFSCRRTQLTRTSYNTLLWARALVAALAIVISVTAIFQLRINILRVTKPTKPTGEAVKHLNIPPPARPEEENREISELLHHALQEIEDEAIRAVQIDEQTLLPTVRSELMTEESDVTNDYTSKHFGVAKALRTELSSVKVNEEVGKAQPDISVDANIPVSIRSYPASHGQSSNINNQEEVGSQSVKHTDHGAPEGLKKDEDVDRSTRDDTVSEEDSDNQLEVVSSWNNECATDDLTYVEEVIQTVPSADDEWNDLLFDSIQSDIGRLLGAEEDLPTSNSTLRTTFNGASKSSSSMFEEAVGKLSMAPPAFPMASLFGSMPSSDTSSQSLPRAQTKKTAPPGFSPADADPLGSRAAFQQLLQFSPPCDALAAERPFPTAQERGLSLHSSAPGRYSLFGTPLHPHSLADAHASTTNHPLLSHTTPVIGRIGDNRLSTTRLDGDDKAQGVRSSGSQLASLGGEVLGHSCAP